MKWEDIGLELGVDPDTLEAINKEQEDLDGKLRNMLRAWFRDEATPTWEAVARAVDAKTVGYSNLARKIREEYCYTSV